MSEIILPGGWFWIGEIFCIDQLQALPHNFFGGVFMVTKFGSILKSPLRIKFLYCPSCKSRPLPSQYKWLVSKFSLEELQWSHFFF